MKTCSIPIVYQRIEFIVVEANNLQEATESATEQFLSTPDDLYIDDSFEIDHTYLEENYPDEKTDLNKIY
jgi:hypothetical protein